MTISSIQTQEVKRLFGLMGLICLLLIVPVKAIRWVNMSAATTIIVGVAPSVLVSSSSRLSRLTLVQVTLLVAAIAVGLEFVQLLSRRGILAKVHYTFDWLDVIASVFSVCVAFVVARVMTTKKGKNHNAAR